MPSSIGWRVGSSVQCLGRWCFCVHADVFFRGPAEVNACAELELVVTGGRAERVVTSLPCHIGDHQRPLALPVEVCFKVPMSG